MMTANTIVSPCIVNSWLYASADTSVPLAVASCVRISSASRPPTRKNTSDETAYMMPIRLWSIVVIQLHKPFVEGGV